MEMKIRFRCVVRTYSKVFLCSMQTFGRRYHPCQTPAKATVYIRQEQNKNIAYIIQQLLILSEEGHPPSLSPEPIFLKVLTLVTQEVQRPLKKKQRSQAEVRLIQTKKSGGQTQDGHEHSFAACHRSWAMVGLHINFSSLVEQFIIPVYMIHAIINFVGHVYILVASFLHPQRVSFPLLQISST